MRMLKTKTSDVMRATTGFHRHDTRWQPFQKVQQAMSLDTPAEHNHPSYVQPRKAANSLSRINAQNVDIH